MKTFTKITDIKARIKTDWSHGNHKFKPGDFVQVVNWIMSNDRLINGKILEGHSYESKVKQSKTGKIGKVIGVTCLPSGAVRSNNYRSGEVSRMYTRYYVQFKNQQILGFHSHHLNSPVDGER